MKPPRPSRKNLQAVLITSSPHVVLVVNVPQRQADHLGGWQERGEHLTKALAPLNVLRHINHLTDTEQINGEQTLSEEQTVHVWLDADNTHDEPFVFTLPDRSRRPLYNIGGDETYESIYETVGEEVLEGSEDLFSISSSDLASEFDDIKEEPESECGKVDLMVTTTNTSVHVSSGSELKRLSNLAAAAGRKMGKLRRHWKLKKTDLSRSLSRIKRQSQPILQSATYNELRRRWMPRPASTPSMDTSRRKKRSSETSRASADVEASNVVRFSNDESALFYITLNIEDVGEDTGFSDGCSSSARTSKSSSFKGSASRSRSLANVAEAKEKVAARRSRRSNSTQYAVIRPTEAPPAPPICNSTTSFESGCSAIKEFYVGLPEAAYEACSSNSVVSSDNGSSESGDMNNVDTNGNDEWEENYSSTLFNTQPLYQFYDQQLYQNQLHTSSSLSSSSSSGTSSTTSHTPSTPSYSLCEEKELNEDDENHYESVECPVSKKGDSLSRHRQLLQHRVSAMELVVQNHRIGKRSMWAELPDVIESGILERLESEDRRLQEALFEVITSEASYLKSLNFLMSHFLSSSKLRSAISKRDYSVLFGDVSVVKSCSGSLLEELEKKWQASLTLKGTCTVMKEHVCSAKLRVYIKYCSNQFHQDRLLKQLMNSNTKFVDALRELEMHPTCHGLSMHSFLMLPMQRITRLPLLLEAILNRLDEKHEEFRDCEAALRGVQELVTECNESARSKERMEEMLLLSQQLDFTQVRLVSLISASRWLVKRGHMQRLWWKESDSSSSSTTSTSTTTSSTSALTTSSTTAATQSTSASRLTFSRNKINRLTLVCFLFNDLLVLTHRKKNNEENFVVLDHCPRNLVTIAPIQCQADVPNMLCVGNNNNNSNNNSSNQGSNGNGANVNNGNVTKLAWLTLLQNHEHKTVEWLLCFNSESDRLRWSEAVTPLSSSNPDEKIYESWSCPMVEAKVGFRASDEDEVDLAKGQQANVLRKMEESASSAALDRATSAPAPRSTRAPRS